MLLLFGVVGVVILIVVSSANNLLLHQNRLVIRYTPRRWSPPTREDEVAADSRYRIAGSRSLDGSTHRHRFVGTPYITFEAQWTGGRAGDVH